MRDVLSVAGAVVGSAHPAGVCAGVIRGPHACERELARALKFRADQSSAGECIDVGPADALVEPRRAAAAAAAATTMLVHVHELRTRTAREGIVGQHVIDRRLGFGELLRRAVLHR